MESSIRNGTEVVRLHVVTLRPTVTVNRIGWRHWTWRLGVEAQFPDGPPVLWWQTTGAGDRKALRAALDEYERDLAKERERHETIRYYVDRFWDDFCRDLLDDELSG